MFQVTNIERGLINKTVELTALENMGGIETLVNPAIHGMAAYECPYSFPRGSTISLRFAPWNRLSIGDRLELSTVLKQPSIQRQLFRGARRNAR